MTRLGMVIDAEHCVGCGTCVVACQMEHALRPGVAWLRLDVVERGRWPDGVRLSLAHGCMQCVDAPCVSVCPTGASFVRADGAVGIDRDACIGCGVCLAACPFGARQVARSDARFFGSPTPAPYESTDGSDLGVAQKCDWCEARVSRGLAPACVAACPAQVRAFGDVEDPSSDAARLARAAGAQPLEGTSTWLAHSTYAREVDVEAELRSARLARRTTSGAEAADDHPNVNAGALVAAVVGGAAAAGAIGVAARASRAREGR